MSDLKQSVNPAKHLAKQDSLLQEEDFDISEYLDKKIVQNVHMTTQLKTTLRRMEDTFGPNKSVISESNTTTEDEDDNEA